MKRLLQIQRIGAFGLLIALVGACVSETEPLLEPDQIEASIELNEEEEGGENLRKGEAKSRAYFERFYNQLDPRDPFGNPITSPEDFALFFPGIGKGNSTHMGKATTLLNQKLEFTEQGPKTVGAPVTQFYSDIIQYELGLDPTIIPDEVSSITTDGRGNSVWFKNIENVVTPSENSPISYFEAQVEIVGGTGKFDGASGFGTVKGSFNSLDGKGESTINGRIEY